MLRRPASFARLGRLPLLWLAAIAGMTLRVHAVILWNNPGTTLVHDTGPGTDILHGAVKRDDTANDTLYFKCHIVPRSDTASEEYFAAMELFDGDTERLGVGNSLKAWAYSAFFQAEAGGNAGDTAGYFDLHTANPESAGGGTGSYQYPRTGVGVTLVFKIQFIPGEDDLVTVWLNPDLGPGANEVLQPASLTTRFNANASFDEIRLRHGGGGAGWWFSDLAIATAFSDFVDGSSERPGVNTFGNPSLTGAYNFQSWQKEQDLPMESVCAIAETADGYLWLAGNRRLARFDGLRFRAFPKPAGVNADLSGVLLGDREGALWIGTVSNGLFCLRGGEIKQLAGTSGRTITALAQDEAGQIWIGTDAGLMGCKDGHWRPVNDPSRLHGRPVTAICKDASGALWVAAKEAGVFQLTNHVWVAANGESVEEQLKAPHCLLVDQAGRLWVGAGEDFILCRDGNHWLRHRIPRHQAGSWISSLAEEADGTVWAGSAGGGLLQYKDGTFVPVPANSGLTGGSVRAVFSDREGRLWVGTDAGLCRLHRTIFSSLGQAEGLGLGAVWGMTEAAPGVIWAGKANGGLYRWNGKSFNRLSAAGLDPNSQVTAMLTARDGSCWVATTNRLLLYKDPVAAVDEVTVIPHAPAEIISLAEDRSGGLLAGTSRGTLWQLQADEWRQRADFSATSAVTAIEVAGDNSLWIGTSGQGLWHDANGVRQPVAGVGNVIRTLYLDAAGTLWIGTADRGLGRWHAGRLACFASSQGLPDNDITQILEDHAGRLWLGSRHGIVCVNTNSLNDLAEGGTTNLVPLVFGRKEGMASEECTTGVFPSGFKTRPALLWFPTEQGVAVVNARYQPDTARAPDAWLEEVLVDGRSDADFQNHPARQLRISPGKHQVEFRYTALKTGAPETVRFRYQLVGLDAGWVDAGTHRVALYNYLPPGRFRFRVAACNRDAVWSAQESDLELVVQRYFWQTWWFVGLTAGGFLMLTVATARMIEKRKIHRRMKQMEQAHALERERTRIAQDLHDEMGAKLCRISFLSEHARRTESLPGELHEQITTISNASREVLHSLDEIVWAVNPRNDTLEHMASYIGQYAEDYFQMTGIQCELDIPTQLPAQPLSSHTRHHLFLAVHEALTNILKHSQATRVHLSLSLSGQLLQITITDNGRGFATDAKPDEASTAAAGDGLINLKKRLASIGGQCSVESVPGQGTRIRFILPLTRAASTHSPEKS